MLADVHAMSKMKTSSKQRTHVAGVMFLSVVLCIAVGIWLVVDCLYE